MEENLRLLQADINDRLNSIDDAYQQLDGLGSQATGSNQDIIIGYYLHVLYGLFENIFEQVAENFGNQIADTTAIEYCLAARSRTPLILSCRPGEVFSVFGTTYPVGFITC